MPDHLLHSAGIVDTLSGVPVRLKPHLQPAPGLQAGLMFGTRIEL